MTEPAPTADDSVAAEPANRLASIVWWLVAAAVAAIAAWDVNDALAQPSPADAAGRVAVGVGDAFPLLIPLGLAWWGKRSDNLGFGILALAVVVVEVAVMRLELVLI